MRRSDVELAFLEFFVTLHKSLKKVRTVSRRVPKNVEEGGREREREGREKRRKSKRDE